MQTIQTEYLGIPVTMIPHQSSPKPPVILYYHGLFGGIQNNQEDLHFLAKSGFTVVGVDNQAHGRRLDQSLLNQIHPENPEAEQLFLELVVGTAREVTVLLDRLSSTGVYHGQKVGITGVSMGGYIAYTAATLEPRISAVSAIVGSPRYKIQREESPHKHMDRFQHLPVLSQNASLDDIVPSQFAREFHQELNRKYPQSTQIHPYQEYPLSGHFLRQEDWEQAVRRSRDFLIKHLF